MGSFITFVLPWYAIGFAAMAFLWRWQLLLPAAILAAVLAMFEFDSLAAADGPGAALGAAIATFLCLGGAGGFVASALVIAGNGGCSNWLRPVVILVPVFAIGFLSYFGAEVADRWRREARLVPPSAECVERKHVAVMGGRMLGIPLAPGMYMESADAYEGRYLFGVHSPHLEREFCSDAELSPPVLTSVSINFEEPPRRRSGSHPYCARRHPELPWAHLVCSPTSVSAISDMPTRLRASIPPPRVDVLAKERAAMLKLQSEPLADGLKTYREKHGFFLERPDGYFSHCYKPGSTLQPYLSCTAFVMEAGFLLSYGFRATESGFLAQSESADDNARKVFRSLFADKPLSCGRAEAP